MIRAHSRLFVVGDRLGWSIDDDRDRLVATAQRLGYKTAPNALLRIARRQAVFQHNHFNALQRRWLDSSHRLGLSYFHGRPGTPGYPEFDLQPWTGLFGPAQLDKAIVASLSAAMKEILAQPDVAERLAGLGMSPAFTTPDEYTAMIRKGMALWKDVAAKAEVVVE